MFETLSEVRFGGAFSSEVLADRVEMERQLLSAKTRWQASLTWFLEQRCLMSVQAASALATAA
jgi:hypothetical protein